MPSTCFFNNFLLYDFTQLKTIWAQKSIESMKINVILAGDQTKSYTNKSRKEVVYVLSNLSNNILK